MHEIVNQERPRLLGDPAGDLLATCRALSEIAAPAGNEDRLTAAVAAHLRARGLEPVVDRLGQVAVELGEGEPGVLVTAHLDELGLVTHTIGDDGMLGVLRLGGVPDRVLPGTRFVVHTRAGDLPAVVGLKSHHLTPVEERLTVRPATELYLDVGAGDRVEAEQLGIRVGDPMTYAPAWAELAGGRFSGKALDDRIGVAVLLALVERLLASPPPLRVIVGFTTQEEFHLRGALALVARYAPDVVVNLDVAPAGDTPDLVGQAPARLGAGPTLSRFSFHGRGTLGGLIPHPSLVRAVEAAAAGSGIPLQHDAAVGVITDAAFVPMATADGIAAVDLGVPCRYVHSPVETAQLSDVSACVDLVTALVPRLADVDLTRGDPQIHGGGLA
jgi:putative aminopeptidase